MFKKIVYALLSVLILSAFIAPPNQPLTVYYKINGHYVTYESGGTVFYITVKAANNWRSSDGWVQCWDQSRYPQVTMVPWNSNWTAVLNSKSCTPSAFSEYTVTLASFTVSEHIWPYRSCDLYLRIKGWEDYTPPNWVLVDYGSCP